MARRGSETLLLISEAPPSAQKHQRKPAESPTSPSATVANHGERGLAALLQPLAAPGEEAEVFFDPTPPPPQDKCHQLNQTGRTCKSPQSSLGHYLPPLPGLVLSPIDHRPAFSSQTARCVSITGRLGARKDIVILHSCGTRSKRPRGGDDDVEVVTSMKTRHPWEVYHTPIRMSRGQPPGEESLSPMRFPTSIIVHCQRYETMRSWRFLVFKRNVRPHLFVHYDYE